MIEEEEIDGRVKTANPRLGKRRQSSVTCNDPFSSLDAAHTEI